MIVIVGLLFLLVFLGWIAPLSLGLRWRCCGKEGWRKLIWLGAFWGVVNMSVALPLGGEFFFAFAELLGIASVVGWLFPMIVGVDRQKSGQNGRFLIGGAALWGIIGSVSFLYAAYEGYSGDLEKGFETVYTGIPAILWISYIALLCVANGVVEWCRR